MVFTITIFECVFHKSINFWLWYLKVEYEVSHTKVFYSLFVFLYHTRLYNILNTMYGAIINNNSMYDIDFHSETLYRTQFIMTLKFNNWGIAIGMVLSHQNWILKEKEKKPILAYCKSRKPRVLTTSTISCTLNS